MVLLYWLLPRQQVGQENPNVLQQPIQFQLIKNQRTKFWIKICMNENNGNNKHASSSLRPSRAACSSARFNALSLQLAPPSPTTRGGGSLSISDFVLSLSSG